MKQKYLTGAALIMAAVATAATPGFAAPPQPDYHPSLGDLMTFAVQPRHIKLGVSGSARNWDYAAYEASELRNAFKRIATTIPTYRDHALNDMFSSGVVPALDKLDAAIKAKNTRRFDAAYREVTDSCNACHRNLDHPFVVIREPSASPYADQVLTGSPAAGRRVKPG